MVHIATGKLIEVTRGTFEYIRVYSNLGQKEVHAQVKNKHISTQITNPMQKTLKLTIKLSTYTSMRKVRPGAPEGLAPV